MKGFSVLVLLLISLGALAATKTVYIPKPDCTKETADKSNKCWRV
jgi:hypothetical protein